MPCLTLENGEWRKGSIRERRKADENAVLAWYLERDLPVTPINPSAPAIKVAAKDYPAVKSVTELDQPSRTAVSIITPPKVTLNVLKDAKEKGVQSVWLQPGTFNDEVMDYARKNFNNVIGGDGGMGHEGWCVLVDGDKALQGREKL